MNATDSVNERCGQRQVEDASPKEVEGWCPSAAAPSVSSVPSSSALIFSIT
jgi:hypothetical protein